MNITEWYVTFVPPSRKSWLTIFGHVQLFGYAGDGLSTTWFFYNPAWTGAEIDILYHDDDVNLALAAMFTRGETYRIANTGSSRAPILPMQNCATIVAHFIGLRAFTPRGLKRQLLRNGAEKVSDGTEQQ